MDRPAHPADPQIRPCQLAIRTRRLVFLAALSLPLVGAASPAGATTPQAPEWLHETGLYASATTATELAPGVMPYSPQYPLWTDGAAKRRFVQLPPGSTIDGSNPDLWRFPIGTKLWKEFSFDRKVETRYMEHTAAGWIYATYAWNAEQTAARRAPERGIRGAAEIRPGVRHDLPGRYDCLSCHQGHPAEVLGFSALQLSSDRDPLAPHAEPPESGSVDLAALLASGLVRNHPADLATPRVAGFTPQERAALGYLHGNCGHCHNRVGPLASLGLVLAYPLARSRDAQPPALGSTLEVISRLGAADGIRRIANGSPEASLMIQRLSSRQPARQMPPLGTHLVDQDAVDLVSTWIRRDLVIQDVVTAASAPDSDAARRPATTRSSRR